MKKLNLKSSYRTYVEKIDDPIPYNRYSEINQEYLKFLIRLVLQGHKVYLPSRMGSIQVKGKEQEYKIVDGVIKGLAPDWYATNQYRKENPDSKKVLYHLNSETNNIRYKIRWSKFNIFAKNKNSFYLRFTRSIKRELAHRIKTNQVEYEVL